MPSVTKSRNTLVEHLASQAPKVPVNQVLSLTRYYRGADLLITQAHLYRNGHNEEQLYVMLMRYASLLIETIPAHKDYNPKDPTYVKLKQMLVDKYLPEVERVKLSLHTKDLSNLTLHTTRRSADATPFAPAVAQINWGASSLPSPSESPAAASSSSNEPWDFLPPATSPSTTGQTSSLPSSSAITSISHAMPRKESMARHAILFSRSTSIKTPQPPQPAASAFPRYPVLDNTPAQQLDLLSLNDSTVVNVTNQQVQSQANGTVSLLDALPARMPPMGDASMPIMHPQAGPTLGPQPLEVTMVDPSRVVVGDTCSSHPTAPPPPPESGTVVVPSTSNYQKEYQKRAELRDVHISVALLEEFLNYAASNTRRSIESCGILAGILTPDDSLLTVNTLIVPKQKGSSDTVEMLSEEEIYDVMAGQGLLPLGWIHTHPSQTCFLSSIDIHTHCGFQTQLEEAVAIVMAPTDRSKKCGIFRLSTPGGMSLIQKCNHRGFHAHPPTHTGQEIYEETTHVFLNPRTQHTVVDLR